MNGRDGVEEGTAWYEQCLYDHGSVDVLALTVRRGGALMFQGKSGGERTQSSDCLAGRSRWNRRRLVRQRLRR